jgi:hypothetical protein
MMQIEKVREKLDREEKAVEIFLNRQKILARFVDKVEAWEKLSPEEKKRIERAHHVALCKEMEGRDTMIKRGNEGAYRFNMPFGPNPFRMR